jgi:hypothetical protein
MLLQILSRGSIEAPHKLRSAAVFVSLSYFTLRSVDRSGRCRGACDREPGLTFPY